MAKILHRFYDLYSGGAEVVVFNLARALPAHQHLLLFNNFRPTWLAAELHRLVNVTLLPLGRRQVRRVLTRESPDVVLFHYYPPMSQVELADLPASIASRAALYNHWHAPVPHIPEIQRYCFPSRSSARLSGTAIPRRKQVVITNPVGDEFFNVTRRKDDAFRLGRHSRGTPGKFSPDFFDLFERIDIPDLQVLSLGYAPYMGEWLAAHAFALKHTYWLLTANTMDVRRFLSVLDLYVYKTHAMFRETCPVCILESLASGVPVVAENRGGIADLVVDGETGILCRTRQDYKDAVEELYANPDRRRRYSRAARQWARDHASLPIFGQRIAEWLNLSSRLLKL
jgi:glycosyltransferase involved in cell wall biosynthesis